MRAIVNNSVARSKTIDVTDGSKLVERHPELLKMLPPRTYTVKLEAAPKGVVVMTVESFATAELLHGLFLGTGTEIPTVVWSSIPTKPYEIVISAKPTDAMRVKTTSFARAELLRILCPEWADVLDSQPN